MSKPTTIKIDEIEYVRADYMVPNQGPIKIAVLDRGFVYVGNITWEGDNFLIMTNAKNIRKWGTTKGLGELVGGPLKDTVLDHVGTVRIPSHSLIHLIDVEQQKWK